MRGEELLHIQLRLFTSWIQILFDEQLFIKSRPGNLKMKRTENFFALTLLSLHWIEGIWIANFTWARHYLLDALHYNLKTKQETTLKSTINLRWSSIYSIFWLSNVPVFSNFTAVTDPKVLIEGVLFRARYLGSTQLVIIFYLSYLITYIVPQSCSKIFVKRCYDFFFVQRISILTLLTFRSLSVRLPNLHLLDFETAVCKNKAKRISA